MPLTQQRLLRYLERGYTVTRHHLWDRYYAAPGPQHAGAQRLGRAFTGATVRALALAGLVRIVDGNTDELVRGE